MQSITVQSHVGEDGILRLQIPVGVKDADLQVTVNYQLPDTNGATKSPEELGWSESCLKDFPEIEEGNEVKSPSIDELEALAQSNGWPPGYIRQVIGGWQGEPPERPPQGTFEVRDEFP
jgi:hypothetical protein